MFPFDFLREITGIKKKHWEKMGNNIYGSGTEEMCVVWLTNVTDTLPFYNIEEKKLATLVFLLGQLHFLNYIFFYVGHICQF